LNAHPAATCYGELLNPKEVIWHPMSPLKTVDEEMRRIAPDTFLQATVWQAPHWNIADLALAHYHFEPDQPLLAEA